MSDFTIEQLEALKEGTTPGPWGHTSLGYEAKRYPVYGDVPGDEVALVRRQDWELVSAAPALMDALIAEKQAYAELRRKLDETLSWWGKSSEKLSSRGMEELAAVSRSRTAQLARILEADHG